QLYTGFLFIGAGRLEQTQYFERSFVSAALQLEPGGALERLPLAWMLLDQAIVDADGCFRIGELLLLDACPFQKHANRVSGGPRATREKPALVVGAIVIQRAA